MSALAGLVAGLAAGTVAVVDLTAPLSEATPVIRLPPERSLGGPVGGLLLPDPLDGPGARADHGRMQRVSVVGNSGAGKSTLSRGLAARLGATHVELDAIFHQPGWTPLEVEEFRRRVGEAIAGQRWVVDGNHSAVRDLVWAQADVVVWLDLPRSIVMRRVLWRTVSRGLLRRMLWNGNRERLSNIFRLDPEQSIIVWAWTRHAVYRSRYEAAATDPAWGHLHFVRLRTPREVDAFLRGTSSTQVGVVT
jgi:adenylate kinase family enzyme